MEPPEAQTTPPRRHRPQKCPTTTRVDSHKGEPLEHRQTPPTVRSHQAKWQATPAQCHRHAQRGGPQQGAGGGAEGTLPLQRPRPRRKAPVASTAAESGKRPPPANAEPPGKGNLAQGLPLSRSRSEHKLTNHLPPGGHQVISSIRSDDPCGRSPPTAKKREWPTQQQVATMKPKEQVANLFQGFTSSLYTLAVVLNVCSPPMNML